MSARWRYTNRLNARASTGPRTTSGKVRVARNALTHGLTLPVLSDPTLAPEVEELAREIAQSVVGRRLDDAGHALACRIAETLIDLRRVRSAKLPLNNEVAADLTNCLKPLKQLARLDRYESRALAQRKRAIHAFYAAMVGPAWYAAWAQQQNKAMRVKVNNSNAAPRRARRGGSLIAHDLTNGRTKR
jgi:hypothetical protein